MSDVAPGFRCGPHALECDADISCGLRGDCRAGNEMLNQFGVHILHRVFTQERNEVLPNKGAIVDSR